MDETLGSLLGHFCEIFLKLITINLTVNAFVFSSELEKRLNINQIPANFSFLRYVRVDPHANPYAINVTINVIIGENKFFTWVDKNRATQYIIWSFMAQTFHTIGNTALMPSARADRQLWRQDLAKGRSTSWRSPSTSSDHRYAALSSQAEHQGDPGQHKVHPTSARGPHQQEQGHARLAPG